MGRYRLALLAPLLLVLDGCKAVVLDPSGDVAARQRDLLVESTGLMLLIIVPVMVLTALFAWHYRQSNRNARYEPDWDHSTHLELVIWGAPLLIIICLGALTWMGTHLLDPYRAIGRIDAERKVPQYVEPLQVDAVALDWKWLFIYPQYGVATVNELAAPVDRPIEFRITASSVMNSFYVPALAGQVYAMPGMESQLHAVLNKAGTYEGFSANYSGAGFSGMHFAFKGLESADFDGWVNAAKAAGDALDRARYLELEKPSENEPVHRFASLDGALFDAILNRCAEPGKMCLRDMAAIDAKGGLGLDGIRNVMPLEYDKYARRGTIFGPQPTAVASLCNVRQADAASKSSAALPATDTGPRLAGAGLRLPVSSPISVPWSAATGAHSSGS